ncbi:MAG: acetate kinase [Planctomycetota bacterium]
MFMLVLNCGSSSIKFQVRDDSGEALLCRGLIERIGEKEGAIKVTAENGRAVEEKLAIPDHVFALQRLAEILISPSLDIMGSVKEITSVGHRVVHGGEIYSDSVLIDKKAVDTIDKLSKLAPLHNPPNLRGIEACQALLPGVPQVAVFDTSFHATMPETTYIYPLPRELYEKHHIRRYGFHGTSHRYVSERAIALEGLEKKPSRIITAHLGNGCSITAIRDGKSVDTSMGFTPLGGLIMGTRTGDIDATLPFYLLDIGIAKKDVINILQKKSGLLGLSGGLSNDMRTLLDHYNNNPLAKLAVDAFCYRLKRYIGSYVAALGGLDILIFTGGIGENAARVREIACEEMECLGITLDKEANADNARKERIISKKNERVKVYVIATNEELVIARETYRVVKDRSKKSSRA